MIGRIPAWGWVGLGLVAYGVAFTIVASIIFLAGTGLLGAFRYPYWQWWIYLLEARDDPVVSLWLRISGSLAATFPLVVAAVVLIRGRKVRGWTLRRNPAPERAVPNPIRGTTDNHGHARWSSMAEARILWPGAAAGHGGVVVGEAYDPRQDRGAFSPRDRAMWGNGGKAPLLIDPCVEGSTHSLIIAGSGSFKTVSAVSTLLSWTGSAVVLDPAGELGPMLEEERRVRMGHAVFILRPDKAGVLGFNVLDWIDTSSVMAEGDVRAVVEWICGGTLSGDPASEFFKSRGKALVTCLLAHMLWDPALSPDLKTLKTLRIAIATPEDKSREVLDGIHETSHSAMARDLAATLKGLADETFSSIIATADDDTDWLSTRAFADLVSGNSFKTSDIVNGRTDVFVSLPLKVLQSTPALARCVVGAFLNAAYEADGGVVGRILFLLDEVARLGRGMGDY